MSDAPNYGIQNAGPGNIHFADSPVSFGPGDTGGKPGKHAGPHPAASAGATSPSAPISNTGPGEVTFSGETMSFGPGGMRRSGPQPGAGSSRWGDAPGGRGGATAPTRGGSGAVTPAEFGDLAAVRRFAQEIDSLGDGSDFVQIIKACHGLADAIRDFGGDMNLRTRAFVDAAIAVATSGDTLRDEAAITARLSKDLDGGE
jgi:hypothetical protein